MESYQNQKLIPKPFNQKMSDAELERTLQLDLDIHSLIKALIESDHRKSVRIKELDRRLAQLEKARLQRPGRKKQVFYRENRELSDSDLVYLIDSGVYRTIGEMERDLGAHKNQLRNRINRERNRMKIARDLRDSQK